MKATERRAEGAISIVNRSHRSNVGMHTGTLRFLYLWNVVA